MFQISRFCIGMMLNTIRLRLDLAWFKSFGHFHDLLTLSTPSYFNGLFHSLCWIKLNMYVGVKGSRSSLASIVLCYRHESVIGVILLCLAIYTDSFLDACASYWYALRYLCKCVQAIITWELL